MNGDEDRYMVIRPMLALPTRSFAPCDHAMDTELQSAVVPAITMIPSLLLRYKLATALALASIALLLLASILALCLFTPLPDIMKFVCIIVLLLAACSAVGFVFWQQCIGQMESESLLVSQKVQAVDTLAQMGDRVKMDTMNYLKAVHVS